MKKNKSYADKEQLIDDFKASGLSMAKFCKQHDIPSSTFSGWLRTAKKKSASEKTVKFVEVTVPAERVAEDSASITVEYKDIKISVSDTFEPELFKTMLKAVMEIYV